MTQVAAIDVRALFEAKLSEVTAGRLLDALQGWAKYQGDWKRDGCYSIEWSGGPWQDRELWDDQLLVDWPQVVVSKGSCEGWLVAVWVKSEVRKESWHLWEAKVLARHEAGALAMQLVEDLSWIN